MKATRPRLVALCTGLLLALSACDDESPQPSLDATLDTVDTMSPPDTAGPDTAAPDTAMPPGPPCDPGCASGLDCCREMCADLRSDASNCGSCGNVCLPSQICVAGVCGKPCASGCSVGQVCSGGFCVADCAPGEVDCDGTCADLRDSVEHCGACGVACAGTEVCAVGACASQCPGSQRFCGDGCVDTTTSRLHCGACDNVCAVDELCAFGACIEGDCPQGLTACAGGCIDLRSDVRNCGACGAACALGDVCQAGACTSACTDDLTDCDGSCTDTSSDPSACGRCGRFCFPGQVCDGGTCAATCGDDREACGPFCVDTTSSRDHCGGCFEACGAHEGCDGGSCACDTGYEDCNDDATDGCESQLDSDALNCGACGVACAANEVCVDGGCTCGDGFGDCDLDPANGCEVPLQANESCICEPGTTESCYTGPPNTVDVGPCAAGVRTCLSTGLGWGDCQSETTPVPEDCTNGIDDDCNGGVDDGEDLDGDGFRSCFEDCCDRAGQCQEPALVHPGAFEFGDNEIDDDCDGTIDNAVPTDCSTVANLGTPAALDLAEAMDICWSPSSNAEGWGLLEATLTRSDGVGAVDAVQTAVVTSFGAPIAPRANATMAVLSSGTARAVGQSGYQEPHTSYSTLSTVSAPSVYLAAHGGELQAAPGCPAGEADVNDSVRLRLKLKVPSNARGLSFDLRFMSSEAPEWLCSEYNDFFLALLDSSAQGIPMDTNISFDTNANPISVNNAFFTTCQPQTCGYSFSGTDSMPIDGCPDSLVCNPSNQCSPTQFDTACPDGTTELTGYTAMVTDAGATAWLTSQAPVVPGEIIELHLHIWDTSDASLDSTVLLDNFEWRYEPTNVNTEPQ